VADDDAIVCPNCNAQKAAAATGSVLNKAAEIAALYEKQKTLCTNCMHKHHEGTPCHVFIEAEINIEGFAADDDDDGFDDGYVGGETELSIGEQEKKPLSTPGYIKRINFLRCNCTVGIPSGNSKFVPLPLEVFTKSNEIQIMTYDRVVTGAALPKKTAIEKDKKRVVRLLGEALPRVLEFVPLCRASTWAVTCTSWLAGALKYSAYVDVRDFVPWQIVKAHTGAVRSYEHNFIFIILLPYLAIIRARPGQIYTTLWNPPVQRW
jgi:hypothetical protein